MCKDWSLGYLTPVAILSQSISMPWIGCSSAGDIKTLIVCLIDWLIKWVAWLMVDYITIAVVICWWLERVTQTGWQGLTSTQGEPRQWNYTPLLNAHSLSTCSHNKLVSVLPDLLHQELIGSWLHPVCVFTPHTHMHSGLQLATASGDGSVKVWDFSKGQCSITFTEHQQPGTVHITDWSIRVH